MKENIRLRRTFSWIDTTKARQSSFQDPGPQGLEGFILGIGVGVEVLMLLICSMEDEAINRGILVCRIESGTDRTTPRVEVNTK